MVNRLSEEIVALGNEIEAIKQAMVKSAMVIGIEEHTASCTLTVDEVNGELTTTQAFYITLASLDGKDFLSSLTFAGTWDKRGWSSERVDVGQGKVQWCVALANPTEDDYTRYYSTGAFNVSLSFNLRCSSPCGISTSYGVNPFFQ